MWKQLRFISSSVRQYHPIVEAGETSQTGKYINRIISPYTATTYSKPNLIFTHGKGSYLYDLENNEYIDFIAGIAVTSLGHSDDSINEIIHDQASKLMHCSNLFHNMNAGELSNKLITTTKQSGGMETASKVFLSNSGTEANEAALKFARKFGKSFNKDKYEIITFENSFHGRSMGSLSVTANIKYQEPFSPLIPGIKVCKANDINSVKANISSNTCGVIIEPIQGEGGVTIIEEEFLKQLRDLCDTYNVVLIYDEIQCGLGRSGELWAHCFGSNKIHPDILTSAKALGNGFPIGATILNERVHKAIVVGDHGTTFGGNPLGSKIGSYVIDRISDEDFLKGVQQKSHRFIQGLNPLVESYPDTITLKGKGLLLGLQFDESINISKIIEECRKQGLLVLSAGMNVIRLVPALNIPDNVIDSGLEILTNVIRQELK